MEEDGSAPAPVQTKQKKKYKRKPSKPAGPKPGQVVIATTADGTSIFCCPECDMAYPEKEQLEMHLPVHRIERRFICGICGVGLRRKEHLERHKLAHNSQRPHVCSVCGKGFKRREHLNLHAVIHSDVKTEMCSYCEKAFHRRDHLLKHIRSHEYKTARAHSDTTADATTNLPEITKHVPTSSKLQVLVADSGPQHDVSDAHAQVVAPDT